MKNWKILLLPATFLLSIFWFACRDQEFDGFEKEANVAFAGRIIDEDGQAIEGAQVRAGNELAVTDANGVFRLKPVRLPARDAKLSVTRIGYFDFSRAFIVQDDALQTVTIQLLRKDLAGTFSGNTGGTVNVPGGVVLNFPAGSVNTSGQVRVFAKYLDPTSSNLPLQMPGDLRAINLGGQEGTLATFGMLGVEIEDQSGQTLQIASGQEVEITMPIQASQAANAPASIPLWYYDHDKARWIEEGSAQKVGNQYVGKVKHFSFWNCDAFSETVYMEGTVFLRDDQHPMEGAVIRLTVLSNDFKGYGYANAEGWFGGEVPKDYAMKLEVFFPDQCGGQVIYTQDIGPFSSDVVLPPIIITGLPPQVNIVTVSGNLVDCSGQPLADGYAKIQIDDVVVAAFTDANGAFEKEIFNCNNSATVAVTGYDLVNLLESATQNFNISGNTADAGDIEVCNALTEYIQVSLDGQNRTYIDPSGFLEAGNTYILASDSLVGFSYISLVFGNNGQTGNFSVGDLQIWPPGDTIDVLNVNTNVTSYGSVGEPIIGTFNGTYQSSNGTNRTVSGSYRVIRDQ
ncbi:MAG: hypothetical protein OHK0019_12960 [Saprospiraceae bacterium]